MIIFKNTNIEINRLIISSIQIIKLPIQFIGPRHSGQ